MKITKKDIQKIKPEICWVIAWGKDCYGNRGYFLPWISGRTRKQAIEKAVSNYVSRTWKQLYRDGMRAVKVKISIVK